jgi:hypothetical protein
MTLGAPDVAGEAKPQPLRLGADLPLALPMEIDNLVVVRHRIVSTPERSRRLNIFRPLIRRDCAERSAKFSLKMLPKSLIAQGTA